MGKLQHNRAICQGDFGRGRIELDGARRSIATKLATMDAKKVEWLAGNSISSLWRELASEHLILLLQKKKRR